MSIVKMKRLRLAALSSEREDILQQLMHLGCVEISEPAEHLADPQWMALVHQDETALSDNKALLSEVSAALAALDKYAPTKTGLFPTRKVISESELYDSQRRESALQTAREIRQLEKQMQQRYAEQSKLENQIVQLTPWKSITIPLESTQTASVAVVFGTIPATFSYEQMERDVAAQAPDAVLQHASTDQEQHYLLLLCLKQDEEAAMEALKSFGFGRVTFKDQSGTANACIEKINQHLAEIAREMEQLRHEMRRFRGMRSDLTFCLDALTQQISREEAKERLLSTESAFFLEGWATAPQQKELESLLSRYACAWEFSDPTPEDNVPVKLKSNTLTRPLNMVTEMYSLPAYTGIDPNGLIMPFFTIFFGIMYADLGYGIILTIIGIFLRKKLKPRGTMDYMTGLLIECGITTTIFGFLFGGCFGDAIPVITENFGSHRVTLWSLIDPLQNPMGVLIGSLVIGAIQIIFGMCVKAYLCIRDGHPLDALFDVGSWWLLFAGLGVLAMGGTKWVALAGVAALVLTQGRSAPSIPGKIIGGVASLYDITSYLSDILSYTRLMALMLATSVIGSVVNILGSLSGSIIVFIIVFLIGHAFNMGINIIGTYVHAARLQYLEFFGKFYEEGGVPFQPLQIKTKYFDVMKNQGGN